jgi:Cu-Zn family superoxide dismutase
VRFYQENGCVLIEAKISGLPRKSKTGFFGFHIHEGDTCTGTDFSGTGSHYNLSDQAHPKHAGDLPPLLSNDGYVWTVVYDSFLTLPMILNRSLVMHQKPDDFTTQPSGNAGEKIACGVITGNNGALSPYPYDDDDEDDRED